MGMSTALTRDQANLLVKRFKKLTAKDLEVSDNGEDNVTIVAKFDMTTIKLTGCWRNCQVQIHNVQFGNVYSFLFDNEFPFTPIKWLFSHRFRCWRAIRNHAIKAIDQKSKDLSRLDEVFDATFPEEVEQQLLGK
jgi:hypothetical protein